VALISNPAVTDWIGNHGQFAWTLAPEYILAQIPRAMPGSGIYLAVCNKDHYEAEKDQGIIAAPFLDFASNSKLQLTSSLSCSYVRLSLGNSL